MRIGVLGLQGDFREHLNMLSSMGLDPIDVRLPDDLLGLRGLILPGGESTTLHRLLRFSGLDRAIPEAAREGLALYGTCAGMILLARQIANDSHTKPFGLIDITVARNAYGRQIDSFEAEVSLDGIGAFPAVFIRAPQIVEHGRGVRVLGRHNDVPVLAQQGRVLVSSFHPEIGTDPRVHRYFLDTICAAELQPAR